MKAVSRVAVAAAALVLAAQAGAEVTLYERDGFRGRSVTTERDIRNLERFDLNDGASSIIASGRRGDRWEACEERGFRGRCVVLRPGQYPSLDALGLGYRVASVRQISGDGAYDERRYAPPPLVAGDFRRRERERLFEADVVSVRAVVEDTGRRCWVEPQQVVQDGPGSNVPGALLGAVIGGILGHQVGGGTGRDLATGIGVATGAVVGANSGRADAPQQVVVTEGVHRCDRVQGAARPAYWDVVYDFRGQEHRVQMVRPPGRTVTVNEYGEPRA